MDYALQQEYQKIGSEINGVSILVLMDYALQHLGVDVFVEVPLCFNPCFNGLCSATRYSAFGNVPNITVSILVLMDYALQQRHLYSRRGCLWGFNPCFDGLCSATEW